MERFEQVLPEGERIDPIELKKAYDMAQRILSSPIEPDEFKDLYDSDNIERDKAYVAERKAGFAKSDALVSEVEFESMRIGKIFEAIVFQHAELSNWFGENAITIQASEFDDIANGVDTIVEFTDDAMPHHLALAIDVTTSANIRDKFNKIKEKIDSGRLTKIRYFVSENLGFKGEKTNVPHVVIGADRKTIRNIVDLWTSNDMKGLAEHPVQIKILEEIKMQLESFQEYCNKAGREGLADIYNRGIATINRILEEKAPDEQQISELELDEVFTSIKYACENIRNAEPNI